MKHRAPRNLNKGYDLLQETHELLTELMEIIKTKYNGALFRSPEYKTIKHVRRLIYEVLRGFNLTVETNKGNGLIGGRDAARQLNCPYRWLPKPTHEGLGLRKYYLPEEVEKMRVMVEKRRNTPNNSSKIIADEIRKTHRSISDLAAMCEVTPISIMHQIKVKHLAGPTHIIRRCHYYTVAEAEALKEKYITMYRNKHRNTWSSKRKVK